MLMSAMMIGLLLCCVGGWCIFSWLLLRNVGECGVDKLCYSPSFAYVVVAWTWNCSKDVSRMRGTHSASQHPDWIEHSRFQKTAKARRFSLAFNVYWLNSSFRYSDYRSLCTSCSTTKLMFHIITIALMTMTTTTMMMMMILHCFIGVFSHHLMFVSLWNVGSCVVVDACCANKQYQ